MPLTRRMLLAAPLFGVPMPEARVPASAMLRPGTISAIGFAPLPRERVAFRAQGLAPAITLPATRVRRAALLPIADRQLVVLAFAADPNAAARLDLGAFVGWDAGGLRVLALEVLAWRAADGGGFATRLTATGDRTRILLQRDAAAPMGGGTRWRRESWTDLLAWRAGAPLQDAPVRTPLPGTFQAMLAGVRARVAARLARPCTDVGEDLVALIAPESLPPGA
jgi:hypothetical protein